MFDVSLAALGCEFLLKVTCKYGQTTKLITRETFCSTLYSCMLLAEVTTAFQMRTTFSETFVEILKASRFKLILLV